MEPLRITATLNTAIAFHHAIHLDALLMAAVARRDNLPPAITHEELQPIEIPVQFSACGLYYLCTAGFCEVEAHELKHINRRFPLEQAQWMSEIKRVNLSAGAQKHFRIPMETKHLVRDRVQWWCIGEREPIADLLAVVTNLGKRRAVGLGDVREWRVEPCDPWPGFPCISADGEAMRNLPEGTPGVTLADIRIARTFPPYWMTFGAARCLAPVTGGDHG